MCDGPSFKSSRRGEDKARLDEVMELLVANPRLQVTAPCYEAQFREVLWHGDGGEFTHNLKLATETYFKPVYVAEIGNVWVHKDDELSFTSVRQITLIKQLKEEMYVQLKDVKSILRKLDNIPDLMFELDQEQPVHIQVRCLGRIRSLKES